MANEVAGIDVLIYIDMHDNPEGTVTPDYDFQLLGGQRGMTIRKVTEVADARHKSSGAWPNRVQTFLDWSLSGDMIKISGDGTQARLESLWRARSDALMQVIYEDGSMERGYVVIADISEAAPHDNVDIRTLDLQGNSALTKIGAGS